MNWKLPIPRPRTALSANVQAFKFGDKRHRAVADVLNVRGHSKNARVKTHRNSRGVIWNGQPYYWSSKGHYRGGAIGQRKPLQWQVWEHANKRTVPTKPRHAVIFVDGNKHNFAPENLALRTKAQIGSTNARAGHHKLTFARRSEIRLAWGDRKADRGTTMLLKRFNSGGSSVAAQLKRRK